MTRGVAFLALFVLTSFALFLLVPFTVERLLITALLYGSGTAVMLFQLFNPRSAWLVPNRSTVAAGPQPRVALTFDDGPSPETTPELLAILRDKRVRATFFVVGRLVEQNPGLARELLADGHVLGNHTYSHPPLFCFLTWRRLSREIVCTQDVIDQVTGCRPRFFRSPVGLRHPFLAPTLRRAGLEYLSWQLRSLDTRRREPAAICERILRGVRSGDIVLLHDRPGPGSRAMLAMLPGLIDTLRSRGFEFALP